MKTKIYKPKVDSFPYRVILFLWLAGETKCEIIREEIGLNEHCKENIYSDRSSFQWGQCIAPRLINHGVMENSKFGYYRLTSKGVELAKTFVNTEQNY